MKLATLVPLLLATFTFNPTHTLLVAHPAATVSTAMLNVAAAGVGDGLGCGLGLALGVGLGTGLTVGVGDGVGVGLDPLIAKLLCALALSNAAPLKFKPPLKLIVWLALMIGLPFPAANVPIWLLPLPLVKLSVYAVSFIHQLFSVGTATPF